MKQSTHKVIFALSLTVALLFLSACSSTRNVDGVTIEENRSYNPLDYIPGL